MRDHLKTAPLNREHVAIGFRAIWQMKLKYCLGATCFTKKQCDKLQARFLPTFLSKMGINRTTATAVRRGPTSLGGMQVTHLETEQAVSNTQSSWYLIFERRTRSGACSKRQSTTCRFRPGRRGRS
jgi:hypothetical protein